MCGLVGARRLFGDFCITPEYIEALRDTMIHRGPDGAGTWVSEDGGVGLGHRRLSVIDLSEVASQPMTTPDGRIRVVFNGEIYNHAELRVELTKLGVTDWITDHSDTEVILRAYQAWGIGCLNRFNGMFAIAIWDERSGDLWLVRDRIGIKPLYWSTHNGRLTFGSEIKALLADSDQPRKVDEQGLGDFLAFICVPSPRTLFEGIHKLAPGCWLRIDSRGRIEERRWYEVWDAVDPNQVADGDELYEQVYDLLSDAVALHKVGDVPMGVFLSGGVDSSANALLFSEGLRNPIRTFSIGYDADYRTYTNELPYARQMAERVGAEHHERQLTERDLLDFLPRMVHLQDEPIADPVCMPVYFVSKLARDSGVTVCQVGEGADELFGGYRSWRQLRWMQELAMRSGSSLGAGFLRKILSLSGHTDHRLFDVLGRATKNRPIFWTSAEGPTIAQRSRLLSGQWRNSLAGYDGWDTVAPIWQRYRDKAPEHSALNWLSFMDLSLRLPELLLTRVDKMSMGVSLEARVPFLDHRLVELALSIPEARKIRGSESKHVLKQALRGRLPDEIVDRRKRGFGVPVDEWLDGSLGRSIENTLTRFCDDTGMFNKDAVKSLMTGSSRVRVWYLFNLALWHRHFIEGIEEDCLLVR